MHTLRLTALALALAASAMVYAHSENAGAHKSGSRTISTEEHAFGREGDPKKATRTVKVDMSDRMRFSPSMLTVKRGETVRFEVKNSGKIMHEMVIGTMKELKAHAEVMRKHPGMEHEEPYMVHVAPGKVQTMAWQFTKSGDFYYGCLIPGHFESGMVGKVTVQ